MFSLVLGSEEVGSSFSSFQEFYCLAFFFSAVTFLLLRGRNMLVGGGYVVSVCCYLYCIPSAPTCIFVKCLPWRRCVSSMNSVGKHITIHALLAGWLLAPFAPSACTLLGHNTCSSI